MKNRCSLDVSLFLLGTEGRPHRIACDGTTPQSGRPSRCPDCGWRSIHHVSKRAGTTAVQRSRREWPDPELLVQDGERTSRPAGAMHERERHSEEHELALTDQFLEVDQPFVVGDAAVSAHTVVVEVVVIRGIR